MPVKKELTSEMRFFRQDFPPDIYSEAQRSGMYAIFRGFRLLKFVPKKKKNYKSH